MTTPSNARARAHIKAMADEMRAPGPTDGTTAQLFVSGMLTGLLSSIRILDGSTAEDAMEKVADQMAAAVGRAYLVGALPAAQETAAATPADAVARVRSLAATWRGTTVPLGTSISRWWDARLAELDTALGLSKER